MSNKIAFAKTHRRWLLVVSLLLLSVNALGQDRKPNSLIIWGDDIGVYSISAYNDGAMGYRTPNIDRIAEEGMRFTDYYGDQSCTAGRSSFITGQSPLRTGLSKVGLPGADVGLQDRDITLATLLKSEGYATGQFGKNHLGDKDEYLPTAHGPRQVFHYLEHSGMPVGIRVGDWKLVYAEQRAQTMALWAEPPVVLRMPKIFNLRRDPFERADHNSNTYWDWVIDKAPHIYMGLATTTQFLQTFKEYPPSQRADSWSVDKLTEQFMQGTE